MSSEYKKLLDHPEKQKIISKLVSGESAKQVSEYLKIKYSSDDEKHLRISAALLQDFTDKFLNQYNFLNKILEDEKNGKLDSKIAESLLNNKTWRERLAQLADDQIDLKKKITQVLHMVETRAEQVFDKIQESPRVTRDDYVLLKYFESLCQLIEKADKIINERPDQTIQHNVTVQMVEQHSVAFQEAIRDLLKELSPEHSARFMELLTARLSNVSGKEYGVQDAKPLTIEQKQRMTNKLLSEHSVEGDPNLEELEEEVDDPEVVDAEFEEENPDDEPDND